jgi:hypothetical protein
MSGPISWVGESQPDDVGKRPALPGGIPYDFAFFALLLRFDGLFAGTPGDANGDWRSVVVAAVVVSHEPVMPTRRDVLLPEATSAPAKLCLLITMQMFEVQLDQP